MPRRGRAKHGHRSRNIAIVIASFLAAVTIGAILLSSGGVPGASGPSSSSSSNSQLAYLTINPSTPVLGSKGSPVTIFEFGDFQCPYCDQWFKTQEPLVVSNLVNTSRAKLVWKDFDYYGPDSTYASEAAYAAGEQGKFWQFYGLLYADQGTPNSGWASRANLVKFAQQLGLNMTMFNHPFDNGSYAQVIDSNYAAGQKLGVNGTPTFFVVGPAGKVVTIVGAQPYSVFASAVSSVTGGG